MAPNDSWKEPFLQYILSNHLGEGNFLRDVKEKIEDMAKEEMLTDENEERHSSTNIRRFPNR